MALKNLNQMSTLGGGGTILNSSTNRGSEFLLRQEEEKKKAEEKRRAQIRALDELEAEAGFRNLSQNKNAPTAQNFGTVGQNKPLSAIGKSGLGVSGKVINNSVATTSPKPTLKEIKKEERRENWNNFGRSVTGLAKRAGNEIVAGLAEIGDTIMAGEVEYTEKGGMKLAPVGTQANGRTAKEIKADVQAEYDKRKRDYLTSGKTLTDAAEREIEEVKKEYEDVLGSGFGAIAGDVVGSSARQVPRLLISAIPGFGTAAATTTMFATSSNSAYKEALLNGATDEEAKMYSILAGAVEAGGEYAIGGVLGQGTGYLDDLFKISKKITNPIARTALKILGSSVGEGFEEMAQSVLTTVAQKLTYDPDAKIDFTELAYEGLIGGLSAGLMSGVNIRGQYRGAVNEIGQINAEKALGTMNSEDILSAIDSVHETAVELGQEAEFNAALQSVYEKAYGDKEAFTARLKNNAKKLFDPKTEADAEYLGILSSADLSENAKIAVANAAAKYGIGTAGTRVSGMESGVDAGSIGEAERLSKLTGSRVEFFDEGMTAAGTVNGYVDADGILHVNRQAKNPLAVVLSHELTHTLEGSSSYDDLSYIVFKTLRESGADIGQMIDDRMLLYAENNVNLTEEDAQREIVADYVSENFMGSEAEIRNIVAEDRPLAVRIREFLDRVLAKFGVEGAQARVQEYDRVREIRDAYKRALGERVDTVEAENQHSISKTEDNIPFVTIDRDILSGAPKSEWAKIVSMNLKNRFPDGFNISNQHIRVNSGSIDELTYSEYSKKLRRQNDNLLKDKYRATDNSDEIVYAAQDWIGEKPKHPRKDNIREFARANALIRIGDRDYQAEILVGTTRGGNAVFHDIVNLQPTAIKEKSLMPRMAETDKSGQPRLQASSSNNSINENEDFVNRQFSISPAEEGEVRDEDVLYERGMSDEDVAAEQEAEERKAQLERASANMREAAAPAPYKNTRKSGWKRLAELAERRAGNPLEGISEDIYAELAEEQRGRLEDAVNRSNYEYDRAMQDYNDAVQASLEGEFVSEETAKKITDSLLEKEAQWQERDPLEALDEDVANALGAEKAEMFRQQMRERNRQRAAEAAEWRAQAPIIPDTMSTEEYAWNNLGQLQQMAEWQQRDVRRNVTREEVAAANEAAEESLERTLEEADADYESEADEYNRLRQELEGIGDETLYTPEEWRKIEGQRKRLETLAARKITEDEYDNMSRNVRNSLNDTVSDLTHTLQKIADIHELKYSPKELKSISEALVKKRMVSGSTTRKAVESAFFEYVQKTYSEKSEDNGYSPSDIIRKLSYEASKWINNNSAEIWRVAQKVRSDADAKNADNEAAVTEVSENETRELLQKWSEYEQVENEYNKLKARTFLDKNSEELLQKLHAGEIKPNQIKGANADLVLRYYETEKRMRELKSFLNGYNVQRKKGMLNNAQAAIGNINDWKDVNLTRQKLNPMYRNVRKAAPDGKTARTVYNAFFRPIFKRNELAVKFKNEMRDRVRKLGISTKKNRGDKLSEAYIVQFVGEGQDAIRRIKAGEAETIAGFDWYQWQEAIAQIKRENPNVNFEKVNEHIKALQQIYDELFEKINEAYVKAGYPPIKYRKGYFPHFQPARQDGIVMKIAKAIGIAPNTTAALPTEINGQTHKFKPGTRFNPFKLSRGRGNTIAVEYDAVKGFDLYLDTTADVIYLTDAIQNLRALEEAIKYKASDEGVKERMDAIRNDKDMSETERDAAIANIALDGKYTLSNFVVNLNDYINLIAGKQSAVDRSVEAFLERGALNVFDVVKSRYATTTVGANLASAFSNVVPITQALANTPAKKVIAGMRDAIYSKDDFAQRSTFLVTRKGSSHIATTRTEEWIDKSMFAMSVIDDFVSESIVRAKYYELTENGISEDEALDLADDYARGIMAGRATGEMPTAFKSKSLSVLTQFQLEVNNHWQWLTQDLIKDEKEKGGVGAVIVALLKTFVAAWMLDEVTEAMFGRRVAIDPINSINETVGDITGFEIPNIFHMMADAMKGRDVDFTTDQADSVKEVFGNAIKRAAEDMPFLGSFVGGGRVPVANVFETVPTLYEAGTTLFSDADPKYKWQKGVDATLDVGQYLLPVYGGFIRKAIQGIDTAIQGGRYRINKEGERYLQYPVASSAVRDGEVSFGDIVDTADTYVKGFVFGRSSFRGAQEWADDNYASLSVDATATYDQLVELGHDYLDAYNFVSEVSRAKKTDTQSAASVKLDMIDTAKGYTDEEKAILYYGLVASEDEREKIKAMMDAGVSGESVYYASAVFRDITSTSYGEEKTDEEKYNELRSYVKNNDIDMSVLDLEDGERYSTSDVKRVYLDDTKISDEEKAYIYRYLLAGEKEAEVFDECRERGDDVGDIYDYLYGIYIADKQADKMKVLGESKISDESKYDIYYFDYALDDEIEALDELKESAPLGEIVETVTQLRRLKKSEEKRDSLSSSPLSVYEQSIYYFSAMASKKQLENLETLLDSGISQVEYYDFLINTLDISGEDKKEQILDYIDSTGMSREEKDLLYLAAGYSENTIDDAPWNRAFGGGIFGMSSIFGDSGIFGSSNSIFGDSGIFGEKGIFG